VAVGMLMYLANNTRPEISFAVNQCAHFSHCPKVSIDKAVKIIVRYLQGMCDKGLIFSPTGEFVVNCYVDADWVGLWRVEHTKTQFALNQEPVRCSMSAIMDQQAAIRIHSIIYSYVRAHSTAHGRSRNCERLRQKTLPTCRTFSKVFEDNNGALQLAKVARTTLRNRHFAVKYHFLREHVAIEVLKIASLGTSLPKDWRENCSKPFRNSCVDDELDFG
jgi:hypothetical protein